MFPTFKDFPLNRIYTVINETESPPFPLLPVQQNTVILETRPTPEPRLEPGLLTKVFLEITRGCLTCDTFPCRPLPAYTLKK